MSTRCPEDATVTRHQGSQKLSNCLAVPPPHLIRKALDVRLLAPETESRQPANDRTLRDRPPDTMEIGTEAIANSQPTRSRPGGNEVVYSSLGNVAAWELRRNDRFEIVNDYAIDIGEARRSA